MTFRNSPLQILVLAASVALPMAGCDEAEPRPETAFDVDEDVDFDDDYAEGEEPPTVVEAQARWDVSRRIRSSDGLDAQCWLDLHTGTLPDGDQRSFVRGATNCGPLELAVGFVDINGVQRHRSTRENSAGAWWQQELTVDVDSQRGNRYVNYVRVCVLDTWQCFGMYR